MIRKNILKDREPKRYASALFLHRRAGYGKLMPSRGQKDSGEMEQTEKRIGIWVFSGTGNTLKCAKALEAALTEQGVSACLHTIENGSETATERDLVLCYPVYGFNMPRILKTFCRNLNGGGNVWTIGPC